MNGMEDKGVDASALRTMSDEDFEALEEILTSDIVPEDCMDLEMLDGFLAGVLISPRPIAAERWLPDVWSAHGEDANFGGGIGLQQLCARLAHHHQWWRGCTRHCGAPGRLGGSRRCLALSSQANGT